MNLTSPIRLLATLLLVFAILAIFISPAFDVPETALQAKQRALQIALTLVAIAMILHGKLVLPLRCHGLIAIEDRAGPEVLSSTHISPLLC